MLVVRLFFLSFLGEKVLAEKQANDNYENEQITLDPLKNIDLENFFNEDDLGKFCDASKYKIKNGSEGDQEAKYAGIVEGHPMEIMAPEIAKKDKRVAAFLIAIAKKESNWGRYSPKKDGKDCYNYWGYRGSYNATKSGYSCFDTPAQAVYVVGERIEDLISQDIDTPEKMIVWKCGRLCNKDSQKSIREWIDDVSLYYDKVNS